MLNGENNYTLYSPPISASLLPKSQLNNYFWACLSSGSWSPVSSLPPTAPQNRPHYCPASYPSFPLLLTAGEKMIRQYCSSTILTFSVAREGKCMGENRHRFQTVSKTSRSTLHLESGSQFTYPVLYVTSNGWQIQAAVPI